MKKIDYNIYIIIIILIKMPTFYFTNVYADKLFTDIENVFIIGEFTDNKPVKLSNRLTHDLISSGVPINFDEDGVYKFNYIVNGTKTYFTNKLFMNNDDGSISNYIVIKDGMLCKNFIAHSVNMGDFETLVNIAHMHDMISTDIIVTKPSSASTQFFLEQYEMHRY